MWPRGLTNAEADKGAIEYARFASVLIWSLCSLAEALGDTNLFERRRVAGECIGLRHATQLIGACALALGCSTQRPVVTSGSPDRADAVTDASALVGTWRLIEFWDRDALAAPKRYAYGAWPTGYFIYDPTGHVSIQIARGPRAPAVAGERGEEWFRAAPTEELRAVVEGFRAYFGTYTVDRQAGVVVHQVEGDSRALYTGTSQRRRFRLVGDSLIIGNDTTARRVLIRVR